MQFENDREKIGVVSIALTCSAYKQTTEDSNTGIYLLCYTLKNVGIQQQDFAEMHLIYT